jgi:heme exporter protein CcmD
MDFSAAHIAFVFASYGLTGICLVGLAFHIFQRDRALAKKLKALNQKTTS